MNSPQMIDAVERVLRVPDEYRTFTMPASDALRRFGLDHALLAEMTDLGLPHLAAGQELMFDPCDLDNVTTGIGLASPQLASMKRWTKSLEDQLRHGRGHFELRLSWRCPLPRHAGACEFQVAPEAGELGNPALTGNTTTFLVEPLAEDHDFGPEIDPLVAAASDLTFHSMPDRLTGDLDFTRRHRLADCRLANQYLVEVAAECGLTARVASGYFVGVPFPVLHAWLEIAVGDRWIPADPFYLHTLGRWGLLSPDPERLRKSPRNVFWRLGTSAELCSALVRHRSPDVAALFSISAQWRPPARPN